MCKLQNRWDLLIGIEKTYSSPTNARWPKITNHKTIKMERTCPENPQFLLLRWKALMKTKRKQNIGCKNIQPFSKYKCFCIAWWRHFCYTSRKWWEFTIFFIQSWKYIKSCSWCVFPLLSTKMNRTVVL